MKKIQKYVYQMLVLEVIKKACIAKSGQKYFSFTLKEEKKKSYKWFLEVTATNHDQNLYSPHTGPRKLNKYTCRIITTGPVVIYRVQISIGNVL